MKRLALFMAAAALLGFTACDDDPKETPAQATDIAGTYNGYTDARSNMFKNYLTESESFTITANQDNTASFSFTSPQWKTYSIESLKFNKKDGVYTVSGSGTVSLAMGAGGASNYSYTLTGTIKSTTDATITIVIASVGAMGDTTVRFVTGNTPDALKICGAYNGYTKANNGTIINNVITDGAKTTIVANEDGTVNVKSVCTQWGTYELENIAVVKKDGAYTFTGAGTASLSMNGGAAYDCTFTMTGNIKSATNATVTYAVTMPAPMNVVTVEFITGAVPQ